MHYDTWVHFIFIWVNVLLHFISFVLLRNRKHRNNEGHLQSPAETFNQGLSLAESPCAALSSHYYFYFYFFANKPAILTQIQHKYLLTIPNLRQLKFTIMWQYKFLNYSSYNLTIKIV